MYLPPESQWRPGLLAAVEAELFALRRATPALGSAFAAAFRLAAGPDTQRLAALRHAGDRVVDAVDAAGQGGELAYHNRHHVAEAVLAMGWLCGMARGIGAITTDEAALGVLAMIGHDLLHDGSPPGGGRLEARSADAVGDVLATLPVGAMQGAVVHAIILGTDPGLIAVNAARAARDVAEGPLGHAVDLLIAMANEADVFASLLPNLGWHLTRRLVQERRAAGFAKAATLEGPGDRIAFLSCYTRLTPSARRLGLAELRDWQLAASERSLRSGAAKLEILSAPATDRRFLAAPPPDCGRVGIGDPAVPSPPDRFVHDSAAPLPLHAG